MGLPTNANTRKKGCTPTSSSCIIWQGKDIDCLELCKGDSIDEVIHQLGCMLCTIKDQLDVDTYDLDCFQLADCDIPHTFRELMQFLLERTCQLEQGFLNGPDPGSGSEDELTVSVASCFQSGGISQTISDYIIAIGEKVCTMETTQANMLNAIQQLQGDVEVLQG